MTSPFFRLTGYIDRIANSSAPTTDQSQRKAFTLIALLKCGGCFAWATMFLLLGLTTAAAFPAFFALIWIVSIGLYLATERFSYFVNIPLFFMLILPLPLQYVLGGFTGSGAVVLWSILTPVGALVFRGVRQAKLWFAGFVMIVFSAIVSTAVLLTRSRGLELERCG